MKLYFDSLTTLKVIHAESPIVIFFGTYGMVDVVIVVHSASKETSLLQSDTKIHHIYSISCYFCEFRESDPRKNFHFNLCLFKAIKTSEKSRN